MSLQPYQQRVVDEKTELDERLRKLSEALNSNLSQRVTPEEFSRLCNQERVMREYSEILGQRIAAFGQEA